MKHLKRLFFSRADENNTQEIQLQDVVTTVNHTIFSNSSNTALDSVGGEKASLPSTPTTSAATPASPHVAGGRAPDPYALLNYNLACLASSPVSSHKSHQPPPHAAETVGRLHSPQPADSCCTPAPRQEVPASQQPCSSTSFFNDGVAEARNGPGMVEQRRTESADGAPTPAAAGSDAATEGAVNHPLKVGFASIADAIEPVKPCSDSAAATVPPSVPGTAAAYPSEEGLAGPQSTLSLPCDSREADAECGRRSSTSDSDASTTKPSEANEAGSESAAAPGVPSSTADHFSPCALPAQAVSDDVPCAAQPHAATEVPLTPDGGSSCLPQQLRTQFSTQDDGASEDDEAVTCDSQLHTLECRAAAEREGEGLGPCAASDGTSCTPANTCAADVSEAAPLTPGAAADQEPQTEPPAVARSSSDDIPGICHQSGSHVANGSSCSTPTAVGVDLVASSTASQGSEEGSQLEQPPTPAALNGEEAGDTSADGPTPPPAGPAAAATADVGSTAANGPQSPKPAAPVAAAAAEGDQPQGPAPPAQNGGAGDAVSQTGGEQLSAAEDFFLSILHSRLGPAGHLGKRLLALRQAGGVSNALKVRLAAFHLKPA